MQNFCRELSSKKGCASHDMKKRVLILCLVSLVCLVGLLSIPRKNVIPSVSTKFLGFTNSSGQPEALFALSNPPAAAFSIHSVRRISTNDVAARDAGRFSWARRERWGLQSAIAVNTTNEPLRIVFRFQQRAIGPRRIVEQLRELLGRITGKEREFFTGSKFFVTNETQTRIIAQ